MLAENIDIVTHNKDWTDLAQAISSGISAVAAIVSAVIAGFLIQQIKLQKQQLESQENWNRINASFTYFEDAYLYKLLDEMETRLAVIGVDDSDKNTFTKDIIENLLNPKTQPYIEARKAVLRVLNFLEAYALAGQTAPPAIDKEVAKEMYGFYIVYWYDFFGEFINECRKKNHDGAYSKIETLHNEWKPSVKMILCQENVTALKNKKIQE